MRSMKTAFQLCAMILFAAVVLLPHGGMIRGKLNRTAPEASGSPIMTKDGPDPVPRLPQPKPPINPSAVTA
jgi:hypothetical protein